MVARYHASPLTQRAFCEQVGLPLSTLQWWLVKARREAAPVAPVTFAEVARPEGGAADNGCGWAVEITLRTGVTVRLREPLAAEALRLLLSHAGC
jgi:hypothetical protein